MPNTGTWVYNTIVISPAPVTRFIEGHLDLGSGTLPALLNPGTCLQIKNNTAKISGRHTYEPWVNKGIAVLVDDYNQGRTVDDSYEDGEIGKIYFPLNGDELLMLVDSASGSETIGAAFRPVTGVGTLQLGAGPFVLLENLSAGTNVLAHFMFLTNSSGT